MAGCAPAPKPAPFGPLQVAEVFIQAGHEGRVSGRTGALSPWGREADWTAIVADEATRILRAAGVSVIRAPADFGARARVRLALAIHFDAPTPPCSAGASVGYPDVTDEAAARDWKALYGRFFPFGWREDNYTDNLFYYYNYRYTMVSDAELVLELGEISCEAQALWLRPRLQPIAALIAYFAAYRIGVTGISAPEME